MFLLDNAIRRYDWGSRLAIPSLLGIPASDEPAAEMWMGAHPADPSRWAGHPEAPALDAMIAADPTGMLGDSVAARFGTRLPFLMKLLAAERSLSIQVHPTMAQARAGFADEQARGVAPGAAERNYVDDNHKPELMCALSELEALCGFRAVEESLEFLDELIVYGAEPMQPYRDLLAGDEGLRATVTTILSLPQPARTLVVDGVSRACLSVARQGGRFSAAARALSLVAEDFPGDVGLALGIFLNYVRLRPGEAIFLGAGNVHAYLRGFGVEILANSDNVLRCGLTHKHIDVAELLRVADFRPLPNPRATVREYNAGHWVYPVPVPDFELSRLRPKLANPEHRVELAGQGPHVVACVEGQVGLLEASGDTITLNRGASAFVRAGQDPVSVTGDGVAFVAGTGEPAET
jgi:mannose-6-phosphate isomerase